MNVFTTEKFLYEKVITQIYLVKFIQQIFFEYLLCTSSSH